MSTENQALLLSEGETLLRRLFEVAVNRLQDRSISMQYKPAVIQWLLGQSDWQMSLNPLLTLDGYWHSQVGSVIENLLLEKRLRTGDALVIGVSDIPTSPSVQFEIATPTKK